MAKISQFFHNAKTMLFALVVCCVSLNSFAYTCSTDTYSVSGKSYTIEYCDENNSAWNDYDSYNSGAGWYWWYDSDCQYGWFCKVKCPNNCYCSGIKGDRAYSTIVGCSPGASKPVILNDVSDESDGYMGVHACPTSHPTSDRWADEISDCYKNVTSGYYISGTSAPTCTSGYYCPGGKIYYNDNGKYACPKGSYGISTGASSINKCYKCPNGYTTSSTATVGSGNGSHPCTACSNNNGHVSSWVTPSFVANTANSNLYTLTNLCTISTCDAGYYLSNGSCVAVGKGYYSPSRSASRTQCPTAYPNTDSTTSGSVTSCYATKTATCVQQGCSNPDTTGCSSVTCASSCSCAGSTYKQYANSAGTGNGSTSGTTSESCTKARSSLSAKANYYVNGTTSCPACNVSFTNSGTDTTTTSTCPSGTTKANATATAQTYTQTCYHQTSSGGNIGSSSCTGTQSCGTKSYGTCTITGCAAGYYLSDGSCVAVGTGYYSPSGATTRTQCPTAYPNTDTTTAGSVTSCYATKTASCTQNACSNPDTTGCSSFTCSSCSCAGTTYKQYANSAGTGNGTTSGTTSESCTKAVASLSAKANYYVNDITSCPACNVSFSNSGTDTTSTSTCPSGTIKSNATSTSQSYTQTCYHQTSSGGNITYNSCTGTQSCGTKSYGTCTATGCSGGYTLSNGECAGNTITLDWNENGGNAIANGSCTYGGTLTLPAAPTREGFTFAGWKLADDSIHNAGETITGGCTNTYIGVTSGTSVHVQAQWIFDGYTITYNTNGGNEINPSVYVPNGDPIVLPEPVKENYQFNGWYADANLQSFSFVGNANTNYYPANSRTLYAKWKEIPGIITTCALYKDSVFADMGEQGCVYAKSGSGGASSMGTSAQPSSVCVESGLATNPSTWVVIDADGVKAAGETTCINVTKTSTGVKSDLVTERNLTTGSNCWCRFTGYTSLSDVYSPLKSDWFYVTLSGTASVSNCKSYCSSTCAQHFNARNSEFANSSYKNNMNICPETYTVTYETNGAGTIEPDTSMGTAITLPSPTKTNYSFDGWYSDSQFTNKAGDGGELYYPYASITLYAKWVLDSCAAGEYKNGDVCAICPEGYRSSTGGINDTPNNIDECYRPCTTSNIQHSVNVSGNDYYGEGLDTCIVSTCESGYHVNPDLNNIIGLIDSGDDFAKVAINGGSWSNNAQSYGLSTVNDTGKFLIDYGAKGIVKGYGTCSARSGTNPRESTLRVYYRFFEENVANDLSSYASGKYCYCNLNRYVPVNGDTATILMPHLLKGVYENTQTCENNCSDACSSDLYCNEDLCIDFRTAIFGLIDSICVPDMYTVSYNTNGGNEISDVEYNYDDPAITLPQPTRDNYTFGGWYSDSGLQTLVGNAGRSYTPTSSVTLYAKWSRTSCGAGGYMDNGECKPCPEGYRDGTNAANIYQCYNSTAVNCADYYPVSHSQTSYASQSATCKTYYGSTGCVLDNKDACDISSVYCLAGFVLTDRDFDTSNPSLEYVKAKNLNLDNCYYENLLTTATSYDCGDSSIFGTMKPGSWEVKNELGVINGDSGCAETGGTAYQPGNPTITDSGNHCWCRMEKLDGETALSQWVYAGTDSSCNTNCQSICGIYGFAFFPQDFRQSLYSTVSRTCEITQIGTYTINYYYKNASNTWEQLTSPSLTDDETTYTYSTNAQNINSEILTSLISAQAPSGYEFAGWCDNEELTGNCTTTINIPADTYGNLSYYAKWDMLSCGAGEYKNGNTCVQCPEGYREGINAQNINKCYRSCTTNDIENSTSVTGKFYYGSWGNDTCSAVSCASHYHTQQNPSLFEQIGVSDYGAAIGYVSHDAVEVLNTSTYGLDINNDRGKFVVDYGNKGKLSGQAQCTDRVGIYAFDNDTYNLMVDNVSNTLPNNTGQNCYCRLYKYTSNNNSEQSIIGPWIYLYSARSASVCAEQCTADCAGSYQNDGSRDSYFDFRASAFSILPAQACAPDVYTVSFVTNGGNTIDPVNYAYGDPVIHLPEPTKENNVFQGWYSDSALQNFVGNANSDYTTNVSTTLYAKWETCGMGYYVEDNACVPREIDYYLYCNQEEDYLLAGGVADFGEVWESASFITSLASRCPEYTNNNLNGLYCKHKFDNDVEPIYVDTSYNISWTYDDNSEIACYMNWTPKTYNITYYSDDAELDNITPDTYTYSEDDQTITPTEPTKEHYAFLGWCENDDTCTNPQKTITIDAEITGDLTYYAQWARQITIHFVPNADGYPTRYIPADILCTEGETCEVVWTKTGVRLSNKPARNGHNFANWNSNQNGSGTAFEYNVTVQNADSVDHVADLSGVFNLTNGHTIDLYAQWTPAEYNIKYYSDGTLLQNIMPNTYTYSDDEDDEITPTEPTKEHYAFVGWCVNEETCEEPQNTIDIPAGTLNTINAYAQWKRQITIHFDANADGDETQNIPRDKVCTEGNNCYVLYSVHGIRSTKPARTGYNFNNWNTERNGSDVGFVYQTTGSGNGVHTHTAYLSEVFNLTDGYEITLYAQWTPVGYTIDYILNGGTAENITNYTVETEDFVLNNPTKTGYVFAGWCEGNTACDNPALEYTVHTADMENKTLFAVFNPIQYTFNFNLSGGDGYKNPVTCTYDVPCDISNNTAWMQGYDFIGWSDTKNATVPTYQQTPNGITVLNVVDEPATILLYAVWSQKQVNLIYLYNNGDNDMYTNSCVFNENVAPVAPTREGFRFVGWRVNVGMGALNQAQCTSAGFNWCSNACQKDACM